MILRDDQTGTTCAGRMHRGYSRFRSRPAPRTVRQGRVVEAEPIAGGEPKPTHAFEHAAIVAVKHWTFVSETIAGHGVAGKARVPLCFDPTPEPRDRCRWVSPETNQPLDADRPLALESVVHLETEVAGRALQ
jgi:hypothetical protein